MSELTKQQTSNNFKDRTGLVYGKLTVLGYEGTDSSGKTYWKCRCECGGESVVLGNNLAGGTTRSCGCVRANQAPNKRHGGYGTSTYNIYRTMLARCYNPNSKSYKVYGAKGITVCGRWRGRDGFKNFLSDMGERPEDMHTIDRIDTTKGYSPENCRWTDWITQQRNRGNNRLLTLDGKTQCLQAWAIEVGLGHKTISYRLKQGWPLRDALYTKAGATPTVLL